MQTLLINSYMKNNSVVIKRFVEIDFLRGIAIIVMITTHVYGLHLSNKGDFAIWNWLHFVVPGFLLCSGFVLGSSSFQITNTSVVISWMKKRFLRLLLPFYIYFFVHFGLFLFFPDIFRNFNMEKSVEFIARSVFFLGGGLSLSWLPILFIELTLLFPILYVLKRRNVLFHFLILLFIALCIFTVYRPEIPMQNLTHWVLWTFPFALGIFLSTLSGQIKNKVYLWGGFGSLILFIFLYMIFLKSGISLTLTHHKYPPDLFYLSFALGVEFFLLLIAPFVLKNLYISRFVSFFSINSYRIFFIHYIILDIFFNVFQSFSITSPVLLTIFLLVLSPLCVVGWDKYIRIRLALFQRLFYK